MERLGLSTIDDRIEAFFGLGPGAGAGMLLTLREDAILLLGVTP